MGFFVPVTIAVVALAALSGPKKSNAPALPPAEPEGEGYLPANVTLLPTDFTNGFSILLGPSVDNVATDVAMEQIVPIAEANPDLVFEILLDDVEGIIVFAYEGDIAYERDATPDNIGSVLNELIENFA